MTRFDADNVYDNLVDSDDDTHVRTNICLEGFVNYKPPRQTEDTYNILQ